MGQGRRVRKDLLIDRAEETLDADPLVRERCRQQTAEHLAVDGGEDGALRDGTLVIVEEGGQQPAGGPSLVVAEAEHRHVRHKILRSPT
jgi:hypothetical protein